MGSETSFSRNEKIKNLKRGEPWMKNFHLKPYEGEFTEIDLHSEWYCPQCASEKHKLELTFDGLTLFCPTHHELCEYTYSNREGRDKSGTFLGSGYEWPLSRLGLIESQIAGKKQSIENSRQRIVDLGADIESMTGELAQLEQEAAQLRKTKPMAISCDKTGLSTWCNGKDVREVQLRSQAAGANGTNLFKGAIVNMCKECRKSNRGSFKFTKK